MYSMIDATVRSAKIRQHAFILLCCPKTAGAQVIKHVTKNQATRFIQSLDMGMATQVAQPDYSMKCVWLLFKYAGIEFASQALVQDVPGTVNPDFKKLHKSRAV